jgi:NAD/NADP transhydrogenase beta subunit
MVCRQVAATTGTARGSVTARYEENDRMLFGDAKKLLEEVLAALKG